MQVVLDLLDAAREACRVRVRAKFLQPITRGERVKRSAAAAAAPVQAVPVQAAPQVTSAAPASAARGASVAAGGPGTLADEKAESAVGSVAGSATEGALSAAGK